MTRTLIALLVLTCTLALPSPSSAQTADCAVLPANLVVPAMYRQRVEDLIERSSTLHRQCLAIARAAETIVTVSVGHWTPGDCRARTVFSRERQGRLRARVEIPVSADFAELLAHELEHVVEQIERVDLRQLAQTRRSGVRLVGRNTFETDRAFDAGMAAAGELAACGNAGVACARPLTMVAAKD
jgi:hypothetical protein